MEKIKIADINIGSRFRQEYNDLEELAESIKEHGLLHPVVIDQDNNLCAGGRRLMACQGLLDWQEIPCNRVTIKDEIDLREVELDENAQRDDLSWQEKVALTEEIDRLKKQKYGDAQEERKKSGWSERKTAKQMGVGKSTVQRNMQMAKALKVFPELGKCKTQDEAQRKLKKLMEEMAVAELMERKKAKQEEATQNEQALLDIVEDCYRVGDCVEGLSQESSEQSDLVMAEVDPPYAIELDKARRGGVQGSYNEVSRDDYGPLLSNVARELYRILAPDAWVVWWFAPSHWNLVLQTLRHHGFDVDEVPCIWTKKQGQTNQPDRWMAKAWEPFFLCRKGKPSFHKRGRLNVFHFAGVPEQKRIHNTERPIEMVKEIIETLCFPGQGRVVVPFLGSGNTIRAAMQHGMGAFGWDLKGDDQKMHFTARLLEDFEYADQEKEGVA